MHGGMHGEDRQPSSFEDFGQRFEQTEDQQHQHGGHQQGFNNMQNGNRNNMNGVDDGYDTNPNDYDQMNYNDMPQ